MKKRQKERQKDNVVALTILSILCLILVLGVFYFYVESRSNNFPSKCYTTLQPSSFFKGKIGFLSSRQINFNEDITTELHKGDSMNPTISDNSILLVSKDISHLMVGDIIVYLNNKDEKILHRIIKIEEDYYITKGDNNNVEDSYKPKLEDIRGKVVGVLY